MNVSIKSISINFENRLYQISDLSKIVKLTDKLFESIIANLYNLDELLVSYFEIELFFEDQLINIKKINETSQKEIQINGQKQDSFYQWFQEQAGREVEKDFLVKSVLRANEKSSEQEIVETASDLLTTKNSSILEQKIEEIDKKIQELEGGDEKEDLKLQIEVLSLRIQSAEILQSMVADLESKIQNFKGFIGITYTYEQLQKIKLNRFAQNDQILKTNDFQEPSRKVVVEDSFKGKWMILLIVIQFIIAIGLYLYTFNRDILIVSGIILIVQFFLLIIINLFDDSYEITVEDQDPALPFETFPVTPREETEDKILIGSAWINALENEKKRILALQDKMLNGLTLEQTKAFLETNKKQLYEKENELKKMELSKPEQVKQIQALKIEKDNYLSQVEKNDIALKTPLFLTFSEEQLPSIQKIRVELGKNFPNQLIAFIVKSTG